MRQAITAIAFFAMLVTATCGGHQRNGAQPSALTPNNTTLPKTASVIPPAQRLAARDAGIALSGGGYTLSWKYENPGDYNQDGIVALEDIAPLTEHFNEAVSAQNEWIDGSGDGTIGVADITPIAMNWGSEVTGYRIDGADTADGPWSEVASLTLADGDAAGGRLAFTNEFAPGYTYYRIATLAPEGDAAFSSTLIAPSNEPIIYGVTPTSGYQHEEYTFTATASGQEPLTYAWDFGGGASPNTSSDISPTVTLSDAGEYSATLTISNSYGPTTFPFTLTVSARDTWAHTWGLSWSDSAQDITIDDDGCVYAAGGTTSLSDGQWASALLLKYSPGGSLIWAETWDKATIKQVKRTDDGNLLSVGNTSYGQGNGDVLLISYDLQGELQWAKTWGTDGYEWGLSMDIDREGNIYVAGAHFIYGGNRHILVCKFDRQGNILWARTWEGLNDDNVKSIAVTGDGILICGSTSSFGAGGRDGLLLKYAETGELQWAKTFGGSGDEQFNAILPDGDILYLMGTTDSFGQGQNDGLITMCDQVGSVILARTWGSASDEVFGQLLKNGNRFFIIGNKLSRGNYHAIVLEYVGNEPEQLGKMWSADEESSAYSARFNALGDLYIVGIAENTNGAWENVEGTWLELQLSAKDVEGVVRIIQGEQTIQATSGYEPTGTLDTGGGGDDVLILKNYPN